MLTQFALKQACEQKNDPEIFRLKHVGQCNFAVSVHPTP